MEKRKMILSFLYELKESNRFKLMGVEHYYIGLLIKDLEERI